ncbi:phosphoglycerate dehydrogenase [Marinilongibacter aquaticus]|uniref:NAD(P)-dependent oxidoreductase n=1 Tax=Marinilongibacter aquaticus TaxID=2975157 RepID=UPI0021BD9319|nr:NAD(P)-dependent oxidoreductase [Marinilongibacter aquaticus]UBM59707.1 phosphoglycerate dehydrogenase [Marinilongibacter aquaticus]
MKVLIVDEMHESIVNMLSELGLEVDYCPEYKLKETQKIIHAYEGLVIRSKFSIGAEFLKLASRLKFIARAGAGLDLIDLTACKVADVAVFSANEANKVAVAEHLMGMLLGLLHSIPKGNSEVKAGVWDREGNRGVELFGKTVGIIGLGNNGRATAERLAAFGCKILAYDKFKYGFGTHLIGESSMEEIFEQADIVSLHVPLTADTQAWVNADFFDRFKKPIVLCNIARGEIVKLSDLVEALKDGKVKGACLDVLENEKLHKLSEEQKEVFAYLAAHENVMLSPHVAGWSVESYYKINVVLRDKIARYLLKNRQ